MSFADQLSPKQLLNSGRQAADVTAVDFAQMRITGTLEYVAGAATLTTVTLLPDTNNSDHVPYLILAGIALILASIRFAAPLRLAAPRASILIGLVFITAIVVVSRPVGMTPFCFVWPMATAAFFLGRRDLAAFLGIFSVALGAGLALNPGHGVDLQIYVTTWSVIVLVTMLAHVLRERIDGLITDLAYTASTDMLTGLKNRRTFALAMDRELERKRRSGTPMTLALFDLDHFKAINDRLGHAEGDRALQRFSSLLASECRTVDVPARVGGEEFALILCDANAEGARIFAERLITKLELLTRHDPAQLSVSVGIVEALDNSDTQDVLLLAADRALYEAKNTGRGKAVVARPTTPSRTEFTGERYEFAHSEPVAFDPPEDARAT